MRFERRQAPEHFDERCRKRGLAWINGKGPNWRQERDSKGRKLRPPSYWTDFLPQLQEAFLSLCAYSCMYEPRGTVDHFVSIERGGDPYDWANFRFAQQWLNSTKQDKDLDACLDPFEVEDNWFEVILPSFQLVLTDAVPTGLAMLAMSTLEQLNLIDGEAILRQREHWFIEYSENRQSFEGLRAHAPLIARAIEKRAKEYVRAHPRASVQGLARGCRIAEPQAKRLLDRLRASGGDDSR